MQLTLVLSQPRIRIVAKRLQLNVPDVGFVVVVLVAVIVVAVVVLMDLSGQQCTVC